MAEPEAHSVAPAARSRVTISVWLFLVANMSGVEPLCVTWFGSAPFWSSTSATPARPIMLATQIGVAPVRVLARLGSAPFWSSSSTTPVLLFSLAI